MTTKHSPLRRLKAQADTIAAKLKAGERGEVAFKDGARGKDMVKVGVVMDDKILTIEFAWATIRETSEAALSEFILKHMREQRDNA
jgi:hypothetical protein